MNVKMNAFLFLCLFCLYSYAHGSPRFARRLSWTKNFLKSTRDDPKPSTGTSWSKNFLKSTINNPKPTTGTSWSKNFLASTKPASTNLFSNSKGSSFSSFKPFAPLSTSIGSWSKNFKPFTPLSTKTPLMPFSTSYKTTTKNWLGNYKPYSSKSTGASWSKNVKPFTPLSTSYKAPSLTTTKKWLGNYKPYLSKSTGAYNSYSRKSPGRNPASANSHRTSTVRRHVTKRSPANTRRTPTPNTRRTPTPNERRQAQSGFSTNVGNWGALGSTGEALWTSRPAGAGLGRASTWKSTLRNFAAGNGKFVPRLRAVKPALTGFARGVGGVTNAVQLTYASFNGANKPSSVNEHLANRIGNRQATQSERWAGGFVNGLKIVDNVAVGTVAGAFCAPGSPALAVGCGMATESIYEQSGAGKHWDRFLDNQTPNLISTAQAVGRTKNRIGQSVNQVGISTAQAVGRTKNRIGQSWNQAGNWIGNQVNRIRRKPTYNRPKPTYNRATMKPNSMCWGGDGLVKMANRSSPKQIRDIKVGDVISTRGNKTDIVDYIIVTTGNITGIKMVRDNLIMTRFHPVRPGNSSNFVYPFNVPHEEVVVNAVYNFILRNRSHLYVNNVEAPTLGDGDRDSPILTHEYWGTGRIVSDIEKISKFTKSNVIRLDAERNPVMTDMDGNDVGIVHEALLG